MGNYDENDYNDGDDDDDHNDENDDDGGAFLQRLKMLGMTTIDHTHVTE